MDFEENPRLQRLSGVDETVHGQSHMPRGSTCLEARQMVSVEIFMDHGPRNFLGDECNEENSFLGFFEARK